MGNTIAITALRKNNPWRYSFDEPWPAEQPPLAVFPNCISRYWVHMWSAHRIPQLHFQLSKPDRYFFIQVTTQFIRSLLAEIKETLTLYSRTIGDAKILHFCS
jgi:hypothetical protein